MIHMPCTRTSPPEGIDVTYTEIDIYRRRDRPRGQAGRGVTYLGVCASSDHTIHEHLVGHVQEDEGVCFGAGVQQSLGLRLGARESVQEPALGHAVVLRPEGGRERKRGGKEGRRGREKRRGRSQDR